MTTLLIALAVSAAASSPDLPKLDDNCHWTVTPIEHKIKAPAKAASSSVVKHKYFYHKPKEENYEIICDDVIPTLPAIALPPETIPDAPFSPIPTLPVPETFPDLFVVPTVQPIPNEPPTFEQVSGPSYGYPVPYPVGIAIPIALTAVSSIPEPPIWAFVLYGAILLVFQYLRRNHVLSH